MKLFLSLFLSVCISLSPLYSSAEIPDLMPVYKTDQMTIDQVAVDSQTLLGEMKEALNNPSARKEISKNLDKPDFQKGLFAGLEKQGMAKEDIAELQQSLNDPVLREEAFSQIANLDMEKAEALSNNQSFQEETLLQNSELIAQLNHNIDQMIESDHAPGSMAMLGAGPALYAVAIGLAVAFAGSFFGGIAGTLNIDFHHFGKAFARGFFTGIIFGATATAVIYAKGILLSILVAGGAVVLILAGLLLGILLTEELFL